MDKDATISKNIIDHRTVAKHGISGIVGFLVGIFGYSYFSSSPSEIPPTDPDYDLAIIVSTALDRGQDFWSSFIGDWRTAKVVLFKNHEQTSCGLASTTTGPFYCPSSEKIYLDLSFLLTIRGDLARMYVVAHELGHHVQKVRGEIQGRDQVDIELQADCYAGMWMHDEVINGHLIPGDFEGAVNEAAAVGDDRLNPAASMETWTHGSSIQRVNALTSGFNGESCSK